MSAPLDRNNESPELTKIMWFLLAGAIGFIVDAVFLYSFSTFTNPFVARIGSFFIAVVVTWRINVLATFGHEGKGITHYVSGQVFGILLNYLIFSASLHMLPGGDLSLLLALGIGSAFAMIFNYMAMKHWVFQRSDTN